MSGYLHGSAMGSFHQLLDDVAQQLRGLFTSNATNVWGDESLYQLPTTYTNTAVVLPVTVMFVDLRGFTMMVESCPPNQVIRQLNEYFSAMTQIVVEHGGTIDKYMGDEFMAYFDTANPLDSPYAAYHAIQAGIAIQCKLAQLNARWKAQGLPELDCGIGINTGPVLKGNIGSMFKMDTTIIGDTVNVASRLQSLTKDYHAKLLVSEKTCKLIEGEFPLNCLGEVPIRGRKKPVTLYEVDPKLLDSAIKDAASLATEQLKEAPHY